MISLTPVLGLIICSSTIRCFADPAVFAYKLPNSLKMSLCNKLKKFLNFRAKG